MVDFAVHLNAQEEAAVALVLQQLVDVFGDEDGLNGGDRGGAVLGDRQAGRVWQRIFVDVDGWRRLGDPTFKKHFRMGRPVFQELCLVVGNHLEQQGRLQRIRTPVDVMLLMGIWILANQDTFRSTAAIFNVNSSVVHGHYLVTIEALRELGPNYIKWPTAIERDVTKVYYETKFGYPGVVGSIDGTLIEITKPSVQPQRYVDRHHSYSLNVQAVCDHRLLIRDLYVGQPGSVNDARVYSRSPISTSLLTRPLLLDADEHILGDGAYVLTNKVISPYRDNGALTRRQRHHNFIHSGVRASIERGFGLLKGKWRRLKKFHCMRMDYAYDHVIASIVLHNLVILGQESDGMQNAPEQLEVEDLDLQALQQEAQNEGLLKRDFIAEFLYPNYAV